MLEKIKAIWNNVKAWFIKIWNKLVKFFKKQEEIPSTAVAEVKPIEEIKTVVGEPIQTKKAK